MITMNRLILCLCAMLFTRLSTGLASINTVKSEKLKDNSCFTLQGTLAQAGHKGIYIKNGKKVIL